MTMQLELLPVGWTCGTMPTAPLKQLALPLTLPGSCSMTKALLRSKPGKDHPVPSFLPLPISHLPNPPSPLSRRLAPAAPLACVLPGSCCMMTVSARSKPGKALPPCPPPPPALLPRHLSPLTLPGSCSMTKGSPRVEPGRHLLRCTVLCYAVLCCAVLCCAVLCCAALCCAVSVELHIKHLLFKAEACALPSSSPPAHPQTTHSSAHSSTLNGTVVYFQGGGACPQARPVQEGSPQRTPAGARSQPELPSRPPSKCLVAFATCLIALLPKWQGFAVCPTLCLIRKHKLVSLGICLYPFAQSMEA